MSHRSSIVRGMLWSCAFSLVMVQPLAAAMDPVDLRCEYLPQPLGIDARAPRFSWLLHSEQRAQGQSAYRVVVAASAAAEMEDASPLWDSGRVESDRTLEVPYAGPPLKSGARYFWKVKVWDRERGESHWSEVRWFEMGLLAAEDWGGTWIGANVPADPLPMLRKSFTVTKPVASARLYICGLGYYEAHLNGAKIGDRLLESPDTQHDKRNLYTTYDVTAQVRRGANALGVELGRSFYDLEEGNSWSWNSAPWRDHPKVIAQLNLVYADGSHEAIVSDASWKVYLDGPVRHNSLYYGDQYDARKEVPGWDAEGFDDSAWKPAVAVAAPCRKGQPPARLCAHAMPPIRVIESKKPAGVQQPKPGLFVFDVGHTTSGWIALTASAPAGTTITLRYHEKLDKDGTISLYPVKPPHYQVYTYTFKGGGPETFEPAFSYNGYRYVQVMDFPGELTVANVAVKIIHQDVKVIGSFTCSNPLLNTLHENQVRTILNNLYNKPTDTPMYEKNGWTGDFNFVCESALYDLDLTTFVEKWFNDIQDNQGDSGAFTYRVPNAHPGEQPYGPPWTSIYMFVPWYLHLYAGDQRILSDHYEGIKKHGDYLWSKLDENKLAPPKAWGSDWQCPHTENPPEWTQLTHSAHTYGYLRTLAQTAQLLGKSADAAVYAERAERIKTAMNTLCYDAEQKMYHTGIPCGFRQTSNVLPFGFDFIPEDRKAAVIANVADDVVNKRGGHLETGCIGTQHLLPALTENGHGDVAYGIINRTDFPSWGFWASSGASWETWGTNARSRDHYWLGTYEAWLYRDLAGIRPLAPGFKEIAIKPYLLGDLTHVRAQVDSVRGLVASGWTRKGPLVDLDVIIPANASATVHVPTSDRATVTEGGVPATAATGVTHLRDEVGYAVYAIGSGSYHFESAYPVTGLP